MPGPRATELGAKYCDDWTVNQSFAQASLPCMSPPYLLTATYTRYKPSATYTLPLVTFFTDGQPALTASHWRGRPSPLPPAPIVSPCPLGHLLPWPPDLLTRSHCHHLYACQPIPSSGAVEPNEQKPFLLPNLTHRSQLSSLPLLLLCFQSAIERPESIPSPPLCDSNPSRAFASLLCTALHLLPQLRQALWP